MNLKAFLYFKSLILLILEIKTKILNEFESHSWLSELITAVMVALR